MLSAIIIFTSVPVFAYDGQSMITVALNKINIVVNGNQVAKAGDAYTLDNGKQVPFSILYEGTTYLPMRKLGEIAGKEANWDSSSNTAGLNEKIIPMPELSPIKADITYIDFKSMFNITKIETTVDDEILYNAVYSGELKQTEFWSYFSNMNNDLKKKYAEQIASDVRGDSARFTVALYFKYSSTDIGYAFSYPEGYTLSNFTKNPFLIN